MKNALDGLIALGENGPGDTWELSHIWLYELKTAL